jgi:hypothetical protein
VSESKRFILISDRIRQNAVAAVLGAPEGHTVAVKPPNRSLDQNAHFHALCSDLARSPVEWFGKRRTLEEWKVLLVSGHTKATDGEVDIVPGLEGEMVNVRESTARMGVARASSLIEYTLAFCASRGVELTETRRGGFMERDAA